MTTVKLTTIGTSTGVIFPKEVLQRLHVGRGDTLFRLDTPGGVEPTPFDPEVARQRDDAERVMGDDRDVLRDLAE